MLIGVPKEIKTREFRVGLVPSSVAELVRRGHEVLIETQAGAGIGANDDEYKAVGATIAATAADVFAKADMIVKVKEPQPSEWVQLSSNQILFTICIWPLMHHKPMVLWIQDVLQLPMKPSLTMRVGCHYWHP